MDRYYQIARCFRDEDLRADRQPEFTQIDIEMSFVNEDQVMSMAEGLMARVFREALGLDIPLPFPRMTFAEAMRDYGVDKPDTRFGLKLKDVTHCVRGSGFKLFANAKLVKALRVPQGGAMSRKEIDELTEFVKIYGAQPLICPVLPEETGTPSTTYNGSFPAFIEPMPRMRMAGAEPYAWQVLCCKCVCNSQMSDGLDFAVPCSGRF